MSNCKLPQHLYINSCNLTTMSVRSMASLVELDLSHNHLTSLALSHVPSLQVLHLANNHLDASGVQFQPGQLPPLKSVDVSFNPNLDSVGFFLRFKTLESLSMNDTGLRICSQVIHLLSSSLPKLAFVNGIRVPVLLEKLSNPIKDDESTDVTKLGSHAFVPEIIDIDGGCVCERKDPVKSSEEREEIYERSPEANAYLNSSFISSSSLLKARDTLESQSGALARLGALVMGYFGRKVPASNDEQNAKLAESTSTLEEEEMFNEPDFVQRQAVLHLCDEMMPRPEQKSNSSTGVQDDNISIASVDELFSQNISSSADVPSQVEPTNPSVSESVCVIRNETHTIPKTEVDVAQAAREIYALVQQNCGEALQRALTALPELYRNEVCFNMLPWAVRLNHKTIVKHLIEIGQVDVNAERSDGTFLLLIAANSSSNEVAKYLLKSGARADVLDEDGNTVLHCCTRKGSSELIERVCKAWMEALYTKNNAGEMAWDISRGETKEKLEHVHCETLLRVITQNTVELKGLLDSAIYRFPEKVLQCVGYQLVKSDNIGAVASALLCGVNYAVLGKTLSQLSHVWLHSQMIDDWYIAVSEYCPPCHDCDCESCDQQLNQLVYRKFSASRQKLTPVVCSDCYVECFADLTNDSKKLFKSIAARETCILSHEYLSRCTCNFSSKTWTALPGLTTDWTAYCGCDIELGIRFTVLEIPNDFVKFPPKMPHLTHPSTLRVYGSGASPDREVGYVITEQIPDWLVIDVLRDDEKASQFGWKKRLHALTDVLSLLLFLPYRPDKGSDTHNVEETLSNIVLLDERCQVKTFGPIDPFFDFVQISHSNVSTFFAWCGLTIEVIAGSYISNWRSCHDVASIVDRRLRRTSAVLEVLQELLDLMLAESNRLGAKFDRQQSNADLVKASWRRLLSALIALTNRIDETLGSCHLLQGKMPLAQQREQMTTICTAIRNYKLKRCCCVCGSPLSDDGLWCIPPETESDGPEGRNLIIATDAHFTCSSCIEGLVLHECNANDPDGYTMERLRRNYEGCQRLVQCPGATQPRRCQRCFDERLVDMKMISHSRAYETLSQARNKVYECKLAEHYENLMKQIQKRLREELVEHENIFREVSKLRMYIVDHILNLRCPRCHQVFVDFEGCCALTCSSCNCGFCAYCQLDCGGDAHTHVRHCTASPRPGDYFCSAEEFQRQQAHRRTAAIQEYLYSRKVPTELKDVLKVNLKRDLEDLGVSADEAFA